MLKTTKTSLAALAVALATPALVTTPAHAQTAAPSADAQAIAAIRNHDAELAQQIADLTFVFDDVMKLDDKSLQLVMKEIASETLIVALKGAAPPLRDKFLSNMSSRAAEALRGAGYTNVKNAGGFLSVGDTRSGARYV